jgi:hypothetical protein
MSILTHRALTTTLDFGDYEIYKEAALYLNYNVMYHAHSHRKVYLGS